MIFRSGIFVTIAVADVSLKSLHTLFDKHLDNMLMKSEQNSISPNYTKCSFLTRVTRLKVAPNMADPISLNKRRP